MKQAQLRQGYAGQVRTIDTHCHINFQAFEKDWKQVVEKTLKNGVDMIIVGTDLKTSLKALEIAKLYSGVYAAVGFHPIHVTNRDYRSEILHIADLISDPKVVAIGEIGFDRYRLADDEAEDIIKKQITVFDFFIHEAAKVNKSILLHNRDAWDLLENHLPLIKQLHLTGVQHCFPGNLDQAKALFEIGFKVGFTGLITYNPAWDQLIKDLPLENILIETDTPYLTPIPYRGERNEPINVRYVAKHIAKIKGIDETTVLKQTLDNAVNLFKLKG